MIISTHFPLQFPIHAFQHTYSHFTSLLITHEIQLMLLTYLYCMGIGPSTELWEAYQWLDPQ